MIVLEQVSKTYDTGRFAVCEVSLRVPAGKMLVLLGGSGCGKTTTLKMINRLIEPSGGRIFHDEQDVTHIDPITLRLRMGYVIQNVRLFPHMTIADNIATVADAEIDSVLGRWADMTTIDAALRHTLALG